MTRAGGRVEAAVLELEAALRAYLTEETPHGVPEDVSAESVLGIASPWLTRKLLDHLPTLAEPWRVVDMRDGEPTRLARSGYHGDIATVRRQGRRAPYRWAAWVGDGAVCPEDGEHIDWPSLDEAQAECDRVLRRDGVTIVDAAGGER